MHGLQVINSLGQQACWLGGPRRDSERKLTDIESFIVGHDFAVVRMMSSVICRPAVAIACYLDKRHSC